MLWKDLIINKKKPLEKSFNYFKNFPGVWGLKIDTEGSNAGGKAFSGTLIVFWIWRRIWGTFGQAIATQVLERNCREKWWENPK